MDLFNQCVRRKLIFAVYMLLTATSFVIVGSSVVSAAYGAQHIDDNLDYGINRAVWWDNECKKYLSDRRNSGGYLRTVINGGNDGSASYRGMTWLSERDKPNVVSPTWVDHGETNVKLQINSVMFLCGALVSPDPYGASPQRLANPHAGIIADEAARWVIPGNPRDHFPNAIGSANLRPAQVDAKSTILSLEVIEGGGGVSGGVGQELRTSREENTRYWFSPKIDTNYYNSAGITADKTLKVRMKYKTIAAYGALSGNGRVEQCAQPGGGNATTTGLNSLQYSSCVEREAVLEVLIKPKRPRPDPVPEPPPGGSGDGTAAGCNPMNISVNPGRDADGSSIPVTVSSFRYIGEYSSSQTINVTSDHTTGNQITVNFEETRSHISGYNPQYNDQDFPDLVTGWTPVYSGPSSWSETIGPCYNYQLNPSVTRDSSEVVEPNSSIMISSKVNLVDLLGDRSVSRSKDTQWQLTEITVQPGVAIPNQGGGNSSSAPCPSYFGASPSCRNVANGTRIFNQGTNNMPTQTVKVDDLEVGTQLCYALSVQPRAHNSSQWRHSSVQCAIVGKKPKVQVHGGDVSVGGEIDTSTTNKGSGSSARTYGSWVEYGALSNDANSGFASASGLNPDSTSNNQQSWSKLTFANKPNGSFGNFGSRSDAPPIALRLGQNGNAIGTSTSLSSLDGNYSRAGSTTISASTIPTGRSVVVNATGTVTIAGNITYANNASFENVPQVVIIANNIDIRNNVTRIDAWLISPSGAIDTCSNAPTNLSSADCDNQLKINGPVVANKLDLRRTAGSGTGSASGDPAEVFNLRADAYLWAYRQASGSSRAQTVYTTELPPRF